VIHIEPGHTTASSTCQVCCPHFNIHTCIKHTNYLLTNGPKCLLLSLDTSTRIKHPGNTSKRNTSYVRFILVFEIPVNTISCQSIMQQFNVRASSICLPMYAIFVTSYIGLQIPLNVLSYLVTMFGNIYMMTKNLIISLLLLSYHFSLPPTISHKHLTVVKVSVICTLSFEHYLQLNSHCY